MQSTPLATAGEDSLFKPFRYMAGQPAPGVDLGGWYHYNPDYDPNTDSDTSAAHRARPGSPHFAQDHRVRLL